MTSKISEIVKILANRVAASRLGSAVFFRIDAETKQRSEQRKLQSKRRLIGAQVFGAGVLIAIIAISAKGLHRDGVFGSSLLGSRTINLTEKKQEWDVFIGESPLCHNRPCHVLRNYLASKFQRKMVLPGREFPLKGFVAGQNSKIFYRTTLIIPHDLLIQPESIKLYSLFIWARNFEFYVNDILVETGGQEALFVSIPKELIERDTPVTLSFSVDPGELSYQGISNYGDMLLGPKSELIGLLRETYDMQIAYPLWFLLPRIALCVMFSLLVIFLSNNREHHAFVAFAFLGVLKFIALMDYDRSWLPERVDNWWAFQLIYPIEQALFFGFIRKFFRQDDLILNLAYKFFLVVLIGMAVIGFFSGDQYINRKFLENLPRVIRLTTIIYGTYLAAITGLYLAWSGRSQNRMQSAMTLFVFFLLALVAITFDISNILPPYYRGFLNYTIELILFVFLAALTALDFSHVVVQRDSMGATLNKVVDKAVAKIFIDNKGQVAASHRHVVVLFSDIRSFTTISEVFSPDAVVKLLNEYFPIMTKIIQDHGGIVDKYIGDAIMAVWGAPMDDPNRCKNAVLAALEMRAKLAELNARRRQNNDFEIQIGIGLHAGQAIAGEVGDANKAEYTVVGDTVNIASRIESATKQAGVDILITDSLVESVADVAILSPVDTGLLKGKETRIQAYKLIGIVEDKRPVTHCPIFDETLPVATKAGIIKFDTSNLRDIKYRADLSDHDHLTSAS